MFKTKKIMSAVLAAVVLISATACSFGKANPDEVIKAAESFAKSVAALDSKKILKNVGEVDDDDADELKETLAVLDDGSDEAGLRKAIGKTIEYEVDEESVEIKKNNATCDINFTMIDYEDALGDLAGSVDDYMEAISSTKKTKDYTVSVELEKDGDTWVVTGDAVKELDKLYSFTEYEFYIVQNISAYIDKTEWQFGDGNVYENTYALELDLWFTQDPKVKLYFVITSGGKELYRSQPEEVDGIYFSCYFDDEMGAPLKDYYIAEGTYTFEIFTESGELLVSEDCTVKVTGANTNPTTPSNPNNNNNGAFEGEGISFIINDRSFADLKDAGWWDYGYEDAAGNWHGYMPDGDVYCSDAQTLSFAIELNSVGGPIYYAYYFLPGENPSLDDLDPGNPVFSKTISSTIYDDGTIYYDCDYTPASLEVGAYVMIVCKDASSISNPYITAVCTVISQTSTQIG